MARGAIAAILKATSRNANGIFIGQSLVHSKGPSCITKYVPTVRLMLTLIIMFQGKLAMYLFNEFLLVWKQPSFFVGELLDVA